MTTGHTAPTAAVAFHHVDVFSNHALSGNGLAVVLGDHPLPTGTMQRIAQELRQFETIFLFDVTREGAEARIFTPEEELTFAGHPVLGAAAVLHARWHRSRELASWQIKVAGRSLPVTTVSRNGGVAAEMDQGPAVLLPPLSRASALHFASALGVRPEQLRTDLPAQVVSTGLPYLLLPVTTEGLAASHVADQDLPSMLGEIGAAFAYVLDPDRPEGRTWDLRGVTEDIATGSAAGPTAAYLAHLGRRPVGESFDVHQGRFVGRPSRMQVRVEVDGSVLVGGPVSRFISGQLEVPTALEEQS